MDPARLSVIVPTFNRAGFLPGCVRSARAACPDAELLIVDDGSTDDTRAVVEAIRPPVRYVRQANQRQSAARNHGLALATGRFVAFLDNDDTWHADGVLPDLLDLLDRRPDVAVAFADADVGNPDDGYTPIMGLIGRAEFAALPSTPDGPLRVFDRSPFFRLLLKRNLVFLGSAVMRRHDVLAAGGFDSATNGAEDWELCLRMAHRGGFAYLPRPLAVNHKHGGNQSRDLAMMARAFLNVRDVYLRKGLPLAPDERAVLVAGRRKELRHVAYHAFDAGDYRSARRRYFEALRRGGWDARTLGHWALCHLPRPAVTAVRGLGRRMG